MQPFTIAFTGEQPMYEQLYAYLAAEIQSGNVKNGERLPSKRALSAHLCVSQNTVENAYALLVSEGYILAKPRSGYYAQSPHRLLFNEQKTIAPPRKQKKAPTYAVDFSPFKVDTNVFPFTVWARLIKQAVYEHQELLDRGDPAGDFFLREQIAKCMHESRGVLCHPDQIIVGAGISYLLMLLVQLLPVNAQFAFENPGYLSGLHTVQNAKRSCIPISVDDQGMDIHTLSASTANVAYVTPSHQYPTGAIMPIGRRFELLNWAGKHNYIIEDDYNSEFRFHGRPIPALQGLDTQNRVIYLSTFSKTIAPSIRIAFMILPPQLVDAYDRLHPLATVSRFEQYALASFLAGGHYSRHVNRMRNVYQKRQQALFHCLTHPKITIIGKNAGLHLWIRVQNGMNERALVNACAKRGLRVYPLSPYYWHGQPAFPSLLLGYAANTPEQMRQNRTALLASWQLNDQ